MYMLLTFCPYSRLTRPADHWMVLIQHLATLLLGEFLIPSLIIMKKSLEQSIHVHCNSRLNRIVLVNCFQKFLELLKLLNISDAFMSSSVHLTPSLPNLATSSGYQSCTSQ